MSQNSLVLPNTNTATFRSNANNALNTLATNNSGTSAPGTTYAYMLWADTTNNLMKLRDAANANWLTLGPLDTSWSSFTTGDVKLTLKTTADTGWVLMNDTTIGNASSGATGRANADTSALFQLLWNNTTDADCPVSGGRGATAAGDYAANKTIKLPLALGRSLAVYGAGSGLTSRALAATTGSENATTVSHTHTITDTGHVHREYDGYGTALELYGPGGSTLLAGTLGGGGVLNTGSATTGISITSSGSSGTGANMQPTVFLNVMIKL